jgi:cytidylate kinase
MSFIVAIDGPAGTGKGTVTGILSKKFKLLNIDTGATYRCVTLDMINKNISIDDLDKIKELLKNIKIELKIENNIQKVYLNGEDVTEKIRSKEVTSLVSQVSSIKEVRLSMVNLQRKMAEGKDVIMEGRDIGTYVFPKADVKIYLDADVEERAKRRFAQNREKGINMSYVEILENIKKRDENDRKKEIGALKVAEDAEVIDSTTKSIKQVVREISSVIIEKKREIKQTKKIYKVRKENAWKKFVRKIVKVILKTAYRIAFRVKITGKVPEDGAYILCCNHINYLDAAAIVLFNKRKVNFVAKEDLFTHGILNWLGHLFDAIPIKRNMQDIEAMKRCLKVLKNGELLGIFPEGTRKGMEKNMKAKNGAAFMAIKGKVKVIPVGIHGTFKPFSKVYMNYGEPIDLSGYTKDDLDKATDIIMEQIVMLTKKED